MNRAGQQLTTLSPSSPFGIREVYTRQQSDGDGERFPSHGTIAQRAPSSAQTHHGSRAEIQCPDGRATPGRHRRSSVLVAEPDLGARSLLVATFDLEDRYEVLWAPDGDRTLEFARLHVPLVLITEIALPGLSGLEVCSALKAEPLTRGVKIIVLTAMAQQTDREQAFAAGADAYLTKPYSPIALLAHIERYLSGHLT